MKNSLFFFLLSFSLLINAQKMPLGFVYLSDIENTIQSELRYLGNHNFIGKPIDGYKNDCIIMTQQTATALKKIQSILKKEGQKGQKGDQVAFVWGDCCKIRATAV